MATRVTIQEVTRQGDDVTVTGFVQGRDPVTVHCWFSHVSGLSVPNRKLYAANLILNATIAAPIEIPITGDVDLP